MFSCHTGLISFENINLSISRYGTLPEEDDGLVSWV